MSNLIESCLIMSIGVLLLPSRESKHASRKLASAPRA